ncbi:MAG: (Fe-S)-binding protein [Candidatus Zixiibacteriota bacterium]|nr:MAG: (Fe-S)-binding protein [candidate division Zixibacteria bacterium]
MTLKAGWAATQYSFLVEKELSPHARAAALEIDKCTSCGLCKVVCPVFDLSHREAESPRGKINLLRALLEEKLDPAEGSVDVFNRCLLCYACQDACPAGVLTERVWIAAREILADEVGRPFAKSMLLRRVLPQPRLVSLAVSLGRRAPGSDQVVRLRGMTLPRPASNRLDRLLPEVLEPEGRLAGTVALFPGCLISEVFPHLGLRAAQLLAALGYRVVTPRDRVCCGAPAFNNGDLGTGRRLAEKNLELFNQLDVECVLSPDATCGGAFTHEYDMLFPAGSQWRSAYQLFRDRVLDFGEFLEKALDGQVDLRFQPLPYRLTVHDSCHLNHLQHKAQVPRRLVQRIPGLQISENSESDLCCGFGGSYSVMFPNESRAISRRKLDALRQAAGMVMVGSPGCLWKLRSEAALLGLDLRLVHYAELLWESLLGGPPAATSAGGEKPGAEAVSP